jgi:hypothetical protein
MEKEARFSRLPSAVQEGIRKAMAGEKPLLLYPVNKLMEKVVGKKAVDDFYWKALQKPVIQADVALGSGAQKITDTITSKADKLFKTKKVLPAGGAKGSYTGGKEYEIPSILAPAEALGALVLPTLGAMKLEEMVRGGKQMENKVTKADLQKTAHMLKDLNEKRAHFEKRAKATELLYKQAEMGSIRFPQTFDEYEEKVAELLSKDLNVVEEAIKLGSSTEENSLGGHLTKEAKVTNARDNFAMSIVEN